MWRRPRTGSGAPCPVPSPEPSCPHPERHTWTYRISHTLKPAQRCHVFHYRSWWKSRYKCCLVLVRDFRPRKGRVTSSWSRKALCTLGMQTHLEGLYTSMSSRSTEPEVALGSVLAKTLRMCPSSEPKNNTVRFLKGPAVVSTAIWVNLYLRRWGNSHNVKTVTTQAHLSHKDTIFMIIWNIHHFSTHM